MTGKYTLLLFKKKRKKKKKKKKFKIVKISLKNTFKSTIFAGFFSNDIGANILKIQSII
jgi:hypothetical protein